MVSRLRRSCWLRWDQVITMSDALSVRTRPESTARFPYRWGLVAGECLLALGGTAGAAQLVTGTFTPPVSDLAPLGLHSWVLPGVWLFVSVAAPSSVAAVLAWRESPAAPTAVLAASAALAVELVVQIPFVGPSVLQGVCGAAGLLLATMAWRARRRGWRAGDVHAAPPRPS